MDSVEITIFVNQTYAEYFRLGGKDKMEAFLDKGREFDDRPASR
jgi:hypothetical protein